MDVEQERLDELTEMRFRQLERLTSALIEGQQDTMQILTEHRKWLERAERRLGRVEEFLTLAFDDLAIVKNNMRPLT